MVVRPDAGQRGASDAKSLCKVSVRFSGGGVQLSTTESSCRAQSLCGGKVELGGQKFESAMKLPTGTSGPCFQPPLKPAQVVSGFDRPERDMSLSPNGR